MAHHKILIRDKIQQDSLQFAYKTVCGVQQRSELGRNAK